MKSPLTVGRFILALGKRTLHERQVIGTSGGIAVANFAEDAVAIDHEHAGELAPVFALSAGAAAERRAQPSPPHARVRELEERALLQIERLVEKMIGIAE